jgi:hypothetical protein
MRLHAVGAGDMGRTSELRQRTRTLTSGHAVGRWGVYVST